MKSVDRRAGIRIDPEIALRVGVLLRDRRLRCGLTLEDIGLAIKFGAGHILAAEEGRFADLPPQPFARGLISAYAQRVGVEPAEILQLCGPGFGGEKGGQCSGRIPRPAGERFIWREWTVPFAFAAIVAVFGIARVVLAPAPVEIDIPAAVPAAAVLPVQQVQPPVLIPPLSGLTEAETVAAPGVRVLLRCEGTTWVEATPDGGAKRRYELGPGQSLEITALEQLSLSLGDAGVVRIRIDERELGFIGFKGETKRGLSFTVPKPPRPLVAAPEAED